MSASFISHKYADNENDGDLRDHYLVWHARMQGKQLNIDSLSRVNADLHSILNKKDFINLREDENHAFLRLKNGLRGEPLTHFKRI